MSDTDLPEVMPDPIDLLRYSDDIQIESTYAQMEQFLEERGVVLIPPSDMSDQTAELIETDMAAILRYIAREKVYPDDPHSKPFLHAVLAEKGLEGAWIELIDEYFEGDLLTPDQLVATTEEIRRLEEERTDKILENIQIIDREVKKRGIDLSWLKSTPEIQANIIKYLAILLSDQHDINRAENARSIILRADRFMSESTILGWMQLINELFEQKD